MHRDLGVLGKSAPRFIHLPRAAPCYACQARTNKFARILPRESPQLHLVLRDFYTMAEEASCGPSNSLQSFQKHTSIDRTLQQDRLATGEPSPQVIYNLLRSHLTSPNTKFLGLSLVL